MMAGTGIYHSVKINHNSDCWGEIEALKEMLRHNTGFNFENYTAVDVISIAVNELYDKLVTEARDGTV